MATSGAVIWRASRTPLGVATLALRGCADGSVRAAAWGEGAEWALDQVPALCGGTDDTGESTNLKTLRSTSDCAPPEWNNNAPTIMLAEKLADVILGKPALEPSTAPFFVADDWETAQR